MRFDINIIKKGYRMAEKKYFVIGLRKIKSEEEYKNKVIGHNNRKRRYKNRNNIDWSKTSNNIVLQELKYSSARELIEYGNSNLKGKSRKLKKGASFAFEIVVDCSVMDEWSQEDYIRYLKDAYEYLKKRFKGQDVINAVIHLDESKPHLHMVISYFNKELGKWNQRGLDQEGITKLHNLLKDFEEKVGKKYGLSRGDGKKLERIKKEILKDVKTIETEKRKFLFFTEKKRYKVLSPNKVSNKINEFRELLEVADIKDLQEKLAQSNKQNKQLKEQAELLAREKEEKEEKIKQLRTEKEELEKETILLKRENAKLKQENKQLEQENNKLKDIVNRLIEELANTKARISQNFDKAKRIIREKIRENLGIKF